MIPQVNRSDPNSLGQVGRTPPQERVDDIEICYNSHVNNDT
jgi:hypothetical protein